MSLKKVKVFMILAMLLSSLLFAQTSWAAEDQAPAINGIEAMQYLAGGSCGITNNLNGTITLTGDTYAYSSVDIVGLTLYLQRWNGTSWINVYSSTFENFNSTQVSGTKLLSVTTGYSYRAYAKHYIKDGALTETGYSASTSVQL